MKVELLAHTNNPDDAVDKYASICYGGKFEVSKNHSRLKDCIASGHTSVLEHAVFTFYIKDVSRILLAELTRHRIASYTVESSRYVKYNKLKPEELVPAINNVNVPDITKEWFYEHIKESAELYNMLLKDGMSAEDARVILPLGTKTDIIMTINARSLLNLFSLRCCNRAYWEIQAVADEMLKLVKNVAPIIFEDAGPPCIKNGKCTEARPCGRFSKVREKYKGEDNGSLGEIYPLS